jgi:7,8-dihydro-6-hydroxymethylpterin dimethyltransferase
MASKIAACEKTTLTGAPINSLPTEVPYTTVSLCPECTTKVDARVFEKDGKIVMEKTCPEHGFFRDTLLSDAEYFHRMMSWNRDVGRGVSNPAIPDAKACPDDCGVCNLHVSHPVLANVDLTNRCNLSCPICFANANVQDYIYEPSYEQLVQMMQTLRNSRPVSGRVIQFSGGEPTLHPDWFRILKKAGEMGFSHVQCATNGLKFAEDTSFAEKSREAGLHTLYLQFDGVDPALYEKTRGRKDLLDIKMKAIENVRKAGLKIVYVPTIAGGINDDQVGKIVQFALDTIDVCSGISFQPVSITGRIDEAEREKLRFTLSDLANRVNELGYTSKEDWFPLSCTTPITELIQAMRNEPNVMVSCHPLCGLGTYFFVDKNRKPTPVTRFLNIKGLFDDIQREADKLKNKTTFKTLFNNLSKVNLFSSASKHFDPSKAPEGLTMTKLGQTIEGLLDKKAGRGANDGTYTYKTLMVAGMHFMDSYNYDVERVKRCVIHYSAPNGFLYPFCTYNSGLVFRGQIEKQFSVSKEEYRRKAPERVGGGTFSS